MSSGEALFRAWIDSVKDFAIFGVDLDGRVASWNAGAARILGYGHDEVLGRPFDLIFTPEDRAHGVPRREIDEARAEEHGWDDRWLVRKDGSRFWASGLLTPLRGEDGSLRGFVKVLRDQTERKRLEDELRRRAEALIEADRRKDEFLAMLAHELRNPLGPILNSLVILRQGAAGDVVAAESRMMIERQVGHLKRLVDDLIDVARVNSGKVELRIERVSLGELVSRAVEAIRPCAEQRRHTLTMVLAPEPIWLDADPTRLEQVLTNLLTNAVKYCEPGGHIGVNTREVDGEAEVRVVDDGVGIDHALLPHVFDLFTQADSTLDRAQGGLGIGLTLTRTMVELHGGTIVATSPGPGEGSEFVVRLPLPDDPGPVDARPVADATGAGHGGPTLRVLVVDDNVDAARSLSLLLRRAGYETEFAHDGERALEAAERVQPDAVFLDIGLPGMNGYDVARALRHTSEATLIAMSGYMKDDDVEEHLFDHYLVKPVHPDELLGLLSGLGG